MLPLYFERLVNKSPGLLLFGIRPTAHSFLISLGLEELFKSWQTSTSGFISLPLYIKVARGIILPVTTLMPIFDHFDNFQSDSGG